MNSSDKTTDSRLVEHRRIWESKDVLRLIYSNYYERILEFCPQGPLLDVGGGSAHLKEFRPDAISLDILPFPGIDVVADAHELPFEDGYFSSIIMLDVLHHLDRPILFLKEAARTLRPGGRLVMVEPGITPFSWWFYHFFHQEPVDLSQDPFLMTEKSSAKDPFDSNQAIPTLLFGRKHGLQRLRQTNPEFTVINVNWLSLFVYPLSGGFKNWCLIPRSAVLPGIAFEDKLPTALRRILGFRIFVALERK